MDNSKEIEQLKSKIEFIEKKQFEFQNYISNLKKEIDALEYSSKIEDKPTINIVETPNTRFVNEKNVLKEPKIKTKSIFENLIDNFELKSNLENFIGTNLINKIGVLILIFGVIVGSKYAIDNNLISPMARVIIGYLISFGLMAFALKLKEKYENFSAVLLSGSLSLLYFLSFIAYDFYQFIPQTAAFGLMFLFTIFAVLASLNYNKQVIALIGLVGSYAIPFLLSNDSGNVLFLFSYITIVNIGILFISFKKYWKPLFYSAFAFTWLIFSTWLFTDYSNIHFIKAIIFASIFFLIFYTTFIAYKTIKKEAFAKIDVVFILMNSFIFFSLGYFILSQKESSSQFLGLFALANAVVHFVVSKVFFKLENTDVKIFYLAIGLVFVFITMAIPIQLSGNWVTLLWSLEAALLFWLGRTKNISIYEFISYPIIVLSFFSLAEDWTSSSYFYQEIIPFLNPIFLTAIIASIAYAFINYTHFTNQISKNETSRVAKIFHYILPFILLITVYFTFANEISQWFSIAYNRSAIPIEHADYNYDEYNYDINKFENLALLFYTIIFALAVTFLNFKKLKNELLNQITLVSSLVLLFYSLSVGLFLCSELRSSYLLPDAEKLFETSSVYLYIRYLNFAFVAFLVFSVYWHIKKGIVKPEIGKHFSLLLHLVILWFLSSELLHWLDIFGNKNAYKLALSILWGSYSLLMVVLGLWKNSKYTRIAAIALFAITLVKLFLYDISNLTAIYKTIVLIILGVLLLVISFLYNKYSNKNKDEIEA